MAALRNIEGWYVHWRQVVLGIGVAWLALFLASFPVLHLTEPTGEGLARGLNRIAAFLTWQAVALVLAIAAAFVARAAHGRGVASVKLLGYTPLAASVGTILLMLAIIGLNYVLRPAFA